MMTPIGYRARPDERAVQRPPAGLAGRDHEEDVGDNFFYILYFQEPGAAEAEFEKSHASS